MGNIKEMNSIPQEERKFYGVAQKQQRAHEDRFRCVYWKAGESFYRCYIVFDGHGGAYSMGERHVANYCVDFLHDRLARALSIKYSTDVGVNIETITKVFIDFDAEMHELSLEGKLDYGTTCTMILIDEVGKKLYQINLGDSRSIIFNGSKIISETKDHTPKDKEEHDRIVSSGSKVFYDRVDGDLAVSRGFGDYRHKNLVPKDSEGGFLYKNSKYDPIHGAVSAVPDIKVLGIKSPMNIILTSDGPFEKPIVTNQSLVDMFNELSLEGDNLTRVATRMVEITAKETSDDVTIIVVSM